MKRKRSPLYLGDTPENIAATAEALHITPAELHKYFHRALMNLREKEEASGMRAKREAGEVHLHEVPGLDELVDLGRARVMSDEDERTLGALLAGQPSLELAWLIRTQSRAWCVFWSRRHPVMEIRARFARELAEFQEVEDELFEVLGRHLCKMGFVQCDAPRQ
jgi:hypothetical protein